MQRSGMPVVKGTASRSKCPKTGIRLSSDFGFPPPERCVTDPFPDLALVHMFSRTVTCIRILCRKIPVPGNSDTDTFQFNILRFVLSDVTRPVCSVELCEGLHTQTHAYDTFYDTFYQAGILSSVSKISETVSVVRKVCSFCRVFYFTSSSRLSSFDF